MYSLATGTTLPSSTAPISLTKSKSMMLTGSKFYTARRCSGLRSEGITSPNARETERLSVPWLSASNTAIIFVLARRCYARWGSSLAARAGKSKEFLWTKNYQPSMWSTRLKYKVWTSTTKKLWRSSNIATYGLSSCAGTTKMPCPRDASQALLVEIIRILKLRVKSCCIACKSPKKKVLYCIPNTSTKKRTTCLSKTIKSLTKWSLRLILRTQLTLKTAFHSSW